MQTREEALRTGFPSQPGSALTLADVLAYYDYPRAFSCRDVQGRMYLATQVEEAPDTWLYAVLSQEQVRAFTVSSWVPALRAAPAHYRVVYESGIVAREVALLASVPEEWWPQE